MRDTKTTLDNGGRTVTIAQAMTRTTLEEIVKLKANLYTLTD